MFKRGESVAVRAFGGKIIVRRVVKDNGQTVVICSEAEYQSATKEERKPVGVGFPKEDVIREPPGDSW